METEEAPINKNLLTPAEIERLDAMTARLLEAKKDLAEAREVAKEAQEAKDLQAVLDAKALGTRATEEADKALAEAKELLEELRQAIKARQAKTPKA